MNQIVRPTPALPVPCTHDGSIMDFRAGLRRWWDRLWMDERTAYLSQATSHGDLERRMRHWDEREREEGSWLL